jgi:uncharacterized protein (TIGR04552 family)
MTPERATPPPVLRLNEFTDGEIESLRLLLHGHSVIDWHRLHFADLEQVDRFLRINEIDPGAERDLLRLEEMRSDAVNYLRRTLGYAIAPDVAETVPFKELFLLASAGKRHAAEACLILKVMHVMHHLAGRELLFKLPVSDDEIFHLVEGKVVKVVEDLRAAGYPVVEFAWGRKRRDSLITQLLAKRATIAAHVYDKLRFRLVTRRREDVLPVLRELLHRLIPFNYVIPGESVNGLVPLDDWVDQKVKLMPAHAEIVPEPVPPAVAPPSSINEFSGPDFRIVSFVADLPVRLDAFIPNASHALWEEYGSTVFVLTEFQIVDVQTAARNESGENSHERYKARQYAQVRNRLVGDGALEVELDPDHE